jgi:hypothetical protein
VLFQSFKLDKEPRERMFAILFLIALNPCSGACSSRRAGR